MNIYDEIGVKKVINTLGNSTVLGGNTTSGEVKEAIESASNNYVDMKELTEAYYTAIKRIKTLNDEVRHLKTYLTTTHEMRKLITPETSEEKLRHYINVSADLRKDIDKEELDASTIASFYKN